MVNEALQSMYSLVLILDSVPTKEGMFELADRLGYSRYVASRFYTSLCDYSARLHPSRPCTNQDVLNLFDLLTRRQELPYKFGEMQRRFLVEYVDNLCVKIASSK